MKYIAKSGKEIILRDSLSLDGLIEIGMPKGLDLSKFSKKKDTEEEEDQLSKFTVDEIMDFLPWMKRLFRAVGWEKAGEADIKLHFEFIQSNQFGEWISGLFGDFQPNNKPR